MTTPADPNQQAAQPAAPDATANCRHCGAPRPDSIDAVATPDWRCPDCERYQDATVCPTCGGNARISLLPEKSRPAVHDPVKRAKAKD